MKKTATTVKTKSLLACALAAATLLPRAACGGLYEEAKAYWRFDAYQANGAAAAETISNACSKSYKTTIVTGSRPQSVWTNMTVQLPNRAEKTMTSLYLPALYDNAGVVTNGTQIQVNDSGATVAGTNITFFARFRPDGFAYVSGYPKQREVLLHKNATTWGACKGHIFGLYIDNVDNPRIVPRFYAGQKFKAATIPISPNKWHDMAISISGDNVTSLVNWKCIVLGESGINMEEGTLDLQGKSTNATGVTSSWIGGDSVKSKNFNGAIQRMAVWDRALSVNEMLEAMESGYVQEGETFKARVTADSSNGAFGKVKLDGGSFATSVTNAVATNAATSVTFSAKPEAGYVFCGWEWLTEPGTLTAGSLASPSVTVAVDGRPVAMRAVFNPVSLKAYWRFDATREDGAADAGAISNSCNAGFATAYVAGSKTAAWTNETVKLFNRAEKSMTSLYLPGDADSSTNGLFAVTNGTQVNVKNATVKGTNITFFARFRLDGLSYADRTKHPERREGVLYKNGYGWSANVGHQFSIYCNAITNYPASKIMPSLYCGNSIVYPSVNITPGKWYDLAISLYGDGVTDTGGYTCLVIDEDGVVSSKSDAFVFSAASKVTTDNNDWIGGETVAAKNFNGAIQRMAVWDGAMGVNEMLAAMESGYVVTNNELKALLSADSSNGSFGKVSVNGGSYASSAAEAVATNAVGTATFTAQPEAGYVFCGWEWLTAPGTITSGFLGSPSIAVAVTGRPVALRAVFNPVSEKAYWRFDTTREDGEAEAAEIKASCSVPYHTAYEPGSEKAVWTNSTVKLFNRDEATMTSLYLPAQAESLTNGLFTVTNGTQVYVKNATVEGTNITFFARFRLDGLSYADKNNHPERREGVFYRNSYTWGNNRGHQFSLYCGDITNYPSSKIVPALYFGQSIVYPNIGIEPGRWYDLAVSIYGDGVSDKGGYTCIAVDDNGVFSRVSDEFDFSATNHVATNTWNYIGGEQADRKNFNGAIQRMAVWNGAMGVNEMLAAMESGYVVTTNGELNALVSAEASNGAFGGVKLGGDSAYASSASKAFATNAIGSATFTAQANGGSSFSRWEWTTTPGTITSGSLDSPTITVSMTEAGRPIALRAVFLSLSSASYIQKGLVAHYDGIENAGPGTHDPDATTWKNLTGDATLDGTCATELSWGVDGWRVSGACKPVTVGSGLAAVIARTNCTIEIACTPTFVDKRFAFFGQYNGGESYRSVSIENTTSGKYRLFRTRISSGKSDYNWTDLTPAGAANTFVSFAFALTNQYPKFYKDGSLEATATAAWGDILAATESVIGGEPWDPSNRGNGFDADYKAAFNGTYHAFRLYDRVLTADEEAVNAAIDAARFNGANPADFNDRFSADSDYRFGEDGSLCVRMRAATGDAAAGTASVSTDWADQAGSTAVTFTAVPNVAAGCSFVRWEGEGVEQLADSHSPTATVNPTSPMNLTAVFCYLSSKSYVSKGLVAHYDGIENDGTGKVHKANATIWKNLTGDTSLDGACTNILSWVNGRGWTVPRDCNPVTITNVLISQTLATTNFTMQIACTPAAVNKRMCYFGQMYYPMGYGSVNVENWTDGSYRLWRKWHPQVGEIEDFSWRPDMANATANTFAMFAFNATPSNTALYVGGTMVASEDKPMAGAISDRESVLGGESQPGSERKGDDYDTTYKMTFNGEYNAFRLYNRSLTADEEKLNAAIDAIRFNGANPADYVGAFGDDSDYKIDEAGHLYVRMRVATGDAAAGTVSVSTNWAVQAGSTAVSFTATPNVAGGCTFVRWEGEGAEQLADPHSPTATVNPTSPMNLTAVFCYLSSQSYVSKGLVAHYDGIENDGVGLPHNSSATTWKNLTSVSGLDGTCAGITWAADGWVNTADGQPITVGNGLSDITGTGTFTMEFACTPSRHNTRQSFYSQYKSTRPGSIAIEHNEANASKGYLRYFKLKVETESSNYSTNAPVYLYSNEWHTVSISLANAASPLVCHLDGSWTNTATKAFGKTGSGFNSIIGGDPGVSRPEMAFRGKYNTFRLYDRVLTADETKVNAAIDAIRFNGAGFDDADLSGTRYAIDSTGHLLVEVRADAEKGCGVRLGDGAAAASGETNVVKSTVVSITAVTDGPCLFKRWEGDVDAIVGGDVRNATISVNADRPLDLHAKFNSGMSLMFN